MTRRRNEGSETRNRLLNWDRGQTASERLAGHILRSEGFTSLDPIHPLGGPDGLKDIVCLRQGEKWIASAHFPNGEAAFKAVKAKLAHDLPGVRKNNSCGIVFVTNQPLRASSREELKHLAHDVSVEIYHLERIASILDSPPMYGVRLEFLDIEMTKDEQLAFFARHERLLEKLGNHLEALAPFVTALEQNNFDKLQELRQFVPLEELKEFRRTLALITGSQLRSTLVLEPDIRALRVPLPELRDFASLLRQICGFDCTGLATIGPHVSQLRVPLDDLRKFEAILDRVSEKMHRLAASSRLLLRIE